MTEALRQAHIALTAIFTHPTLELSDFMRDKLTAAIAAAEAELSQPARVGLTEAEIEEGCAEACYNSFKAGAFYAGVRFAKERHNIPAAPTQERAR